MSADAVQIATFASWAATGAGLFMWLWTWIRDKCPIRRMRVTDCGLVLVFASILTRIAVQTEPLSPFDWTLVFVGPLFIAAGLWRLGRTGRAG